MHEVLTEQREDDVELAELIDRLRAMLVQGLGAGKQVEARARAGLARGQRATALALVFSELLQNALEHGGGQGRGSSSRGATATSCSRRRRRLRSGAGSDGTGLSIVRALVRDELGGTLELVDRGGLRAEVRFSA